MPRGNSTGPYGQSSGIGRGSGRKTGRGVGRMGGNRAGSGPGGSCICTSCGTKIPHKQGIPCYKARCPKCGQSMIRG